MKNSIVNLFVFMNSKYFNMTPKTHDINLYLYYFKIITIAIMSAFYIQIGIKHFTDPNWFMPIMPPFLPYHIELIYISGGFEILFGSMLIFERTRFIAGWGLIFLLIAVYPANLYLAFNTDVQREMNISSFLASWIRLPLQFVFIALAYWHSINQKPIRTKQVNTKPSINRANKNTEKVVLSWIPEVPGYQAQNEVAVELEEVETDK
tara:strand:+ start:102 stop:722 length:621 start_codon:yes stop_codon:yes gene_type:complete